MIESFKLIDRNLFLAINHCHSPLFDSFMALVSETWLFVILLVICYIFIFRKQGVKKGLILVGFLVLLVILTDQTSNRVKHMVKRYRPTHNTEIQKQVHTVDDYKGGQFGFFSSHATNAFGIAMMLFLLFSTSPLWLRSLFFIWAILTSYSRIYLGVHYPSDILVGALVGILWGMIIYKLIQRTFKTYFNEVIAM